MKKGYQMYKGLLGILLSLAMVFTMLPTVAVKAAGVSYGVLTKDNKYVAENGSVSGNTVVVYFEMPTGQDAAAVVSSGKLSFDDKTRTLTINGLTGQHVSVWGYNMDETKPITVLLKGTSKLSKISEWDSGFAPDVPCVFKAEAGASLTFTCPAESKEYLTSVITLDASVKKTENADGTITIASTTAAASSGSTDTGSGNPSTPGGTNPGASNPGAGDAAVTLPAAGSSQEAKDGSGDYKVTKSTAGDVQVTYEKASAAAKKKATLTFNTVTLKDGTVAKVTGIKKSAFKGNKKVKKVTFGANVANVEKDAFTKCEKLSKIYIKSAKIKLAKNSFKNVNKGKKVTVYYPKSLKGKALTNFKKMVKKAGLKNVKWKKG